MDDRSSMLILSLGSGDYTCFFKLFFTLGRTFVSRECSSVTALVHGDWLLQQCQLLSSPVRCSRNSCGVDKDFESQMGSSEALWSNSVTLVMRKLFFFFFKVSSLYMRTFKGLCEMLVASSLWGLLFENVILFLGSCSKARSVVGSLSYTDTCWAGRERTGVSHTDVLATGVFHVFIFKKRLSCN